ncbi:hypothetical protein [Halococcus thailandensis]|uniref:hypothetical protein n=1 Tax=Halococcus thailandensis TaxID=335952 RepID=UPI001267B545|nr:hypothetical protein [Halococcus thailandensis]
MNRHEPHESVSPGRRLWRFPRVVVSASSSATASGPSVSGQLATAAPPSASEPASSVSSAVAPPSSGSVGHSPGARVGRCGLRSWPMRSMATDSVDSSSTARSSSASDDVTDSIISDE